MDIGSGGTELTCLLTFSIFFNQQNAAYLLNITFIFDRCPRSLAPATPLKYNCVFQKL